MKRIAALATVGSAALLLGALGFQYLGDLAPCKMCIWQRWPHLAVIAIGVLLVLTGMRALAALGALAALTTSAIGLFHAGVEQGWWEGPTTCTSGSIAGLTSAQLLEQILAAPLVRCDEIAWQMMGISMAGWNAIISLALAGLWIWALKKGV